MVSALGDGESCRFTTSCACVWRRERTTEDHAGALEKSYGVVAVIGRFFKGSGRMAILGRKNVVLGKDISWLIDSCKLFLSHMVGIISGIIRSIQSITTTFSSLLVPSG